MTAQLFCSLDWAAIAMQIRAGSAFGCFAAPGIEREPANAVVEVARRIGSELVTVCLEFDKQVLRTGFGDLPRRQKLPMRRRGELYARPRETVSRSSIARDTSLP
jgi:hypothetical protein